MTGVLIEESAAEYQETETENLVRMRLRRLGGASFKVNAVLASAGGYCIFGLMLLITASVVGRYFFNRTIAPTLEISESVLVLVVYWALTYREMVSEHVRVEIVTMHFSRAWKMNAKIVVSLIGIGFSALMTWTTLLEGLNAWQIKGENLGFNVITPVALWLPKLAIALGFALFTLYYVLDLYARIAVLADRSEVTRGEVQGV